MSYHELSVGRLARTAPVLLLLFSSCIRYVPSRSEIVEQSPDLSGLGGPEEFASYETRIQARLNDLVAERQALLERPPLEQEYLVGVGDVIDVQVFGFGELSATSEVGADGSIELPLIGTVFAAGSRLGELRSEIYRRLLEYVRSPRAQITVKEFRAHRVSVIGAVQKPGVYPLKSASQNLIELLSLAGGRTERASSRVILIPAGAGRNDVPAPNPAAPAHGVEIEHDALLGTVDARPLLIPVVSGDTIIVPEAGSFKVDGEVVRAGSFPLLGKTSVQGAIAAAGGFSYSADVHEVEVIRDVGSGKKASLVLDLEQVALNGRRDVTLRDGDVVRVPSDRGRFNTRQVVEALNGIFKAGVTAPVR